MFGMKALLVIVLLGIVGAAGYYFFTDSAAVKAYKGFANAVTRGKETDANQFAETDDVVKDLKKTDSWVPMEALHGIHYEIKSQTKNADGTITIEARQSVYFDPPGATSAIMGAMVSIFDQTAQITKTSDGWKVSDFESDFVETKDTRPH